MRKRIDPSVALLEAIDTLPKARVQNVLMRSSDRELAIALIFTKPLDRERILAYVAPAKAARIEDEARYHERLRITYEQYARVVNALLVRLATNRGGQLKSYVRPRHDRSR